MKLFVFQCSSSLGTYGFSQDATGLNLPGFPWCQGRWTFVREVEVEPGMYLVDVKPEDILEAIRLSGYAIAGGSARIGEKAW